MDATELKAEEERLWTHYRMIEAKIREAEGVVERLRAKRLSASVAWRQAAEKLPPDAGERKEG